MPGQPDSGFAQNPRSLALVYECYRLLCEGGSSEAATQFDEQTIAAARGLMEAGDAMGDGEDPQAEGADSDAAGLVGASFAGFELLEFVGQGSSGQVFRARQGNPAREVAIKLLWPCSRNDAAAQRREASLLASLEHPHIARLYQVGIWERAGVLRPWLAMQRVVDARPLDAASTAHLTLPRRVALLADVADAVAHAHEKGVIHRDLKPGNVLLDGGDRPFVIDFGLARIDGAQRGASLSLLGDRIVGSLSSIAPECLRAGVVADARADVFSLGTIAYEVLGGTPMRRIEGMGVSQALRSIDSDQPVRLSALNGALRGDLDRIVAKATEANPAHRYSTVARMAADLRSHLSGQPVLIEQQPVTERVLRMVRRHWRASASLGVAFVAMAVATVISIRFAHRADAQATRALLSAGASALESADQMALDRAVDALADDPSPEAKLLKRATALQGAQIAGDHFFAIASPPGGDWVVGSRLTMPALPPGERQSDVIRFDGTKETWRRKDIWPNTDGLTISPDGKMIVLTSPWGEMSLIDSASGQGLQEWPGGGPANSPLFLSDGRLLVAHDSLVIRPCDGGPDTPIVELGLGYVYALRERGDGTVVVVGERGAAVVDIEAGTVQRRLECPPMRQSALAVDNATGNILVGGWDNTVRLYPPGETRPAWTGHTHRDHVWAIMLLDSSTAMSAGSDGLLVLWNLADGRPSLVPGGVGYLWSMLVNQSGLWIASSEGLRLQSIDALHLWIGVQTDHRTRCASDGWLAWLDLAGHLTVTTGDGATRTVGDPSVVYSKLASVDGGDLLCALSEEGAIVCMDRRDGHELWRTTELLIPKRHEVSEIPSMAISTRTGTLLVAARHRGLISLSLADGRIVRTTKLEQDCCIVGAQADGAIYAGGRDGLMVRLDGECNVIESSRALRSLPSCMAMDATGTRLLLGGGDGSLRILDAATLEERLALRHAQTPLRAIWSDAAGIWTVDSTGMMRCR